MNSLRCDEFMSLRALALSIIEREDVPKDVRDWAARILKQAEPATRYTPPASQFAVETAEERE